MIKEAIVKIVSKEDLTYDEAYAVMNEIMSGETTATQNAAFLAALSTKSTKAETIDEIAGCAAAMRDHATKVDTGMDIVEIVGTGGDGAQSFNISTTAALVAAAGGVKVAKHGNRAASSRSGTADCLEALGVNLDQSPARCVELLKEAGMCFFFAQKYHTSMKYVGPIRKELGFRTVFNILGPLTNPASERKYVAQESRPTVLVVEDNTEMLHFIGQEINVHYNVVTAGNGEEAIARLQEYGIQLIISDIMMPVMDGFTLLKKIKTNLEFSHIPIILLTAKNTLQSRMEGLELGADAYIDKPFSMDLLLTQVTNLLNNRSNMRAYYFNSPIANIKSMAYTKADEKFLKKLNDIIDSHINDVNLDVDMIADLMNLSRPTLYRKINGLSNVTPNELIKISRLKKAAELILQGDMRIYEIAEAVGFNSQSYFSRAFSKQFNMSPSQYAKENNIELK